MRENLSFFPAIPTQAGIGPMDDMYIETSISGQFLFMMKEHLGLVKPFGIIYTIRKYTN
jgi:hypothetical protein